MFLKATGQRSGEIVGESIDDHFRGQIDVESWSWGMSAPSAVSGQRTGRVQLGELRIVKRVDKASTSLMTVMSTNEVMSNVVLTVRKSDGNRTTPYFFIKLTQARISGYSVSSSFGSGGMPVLTEDLALSFKSVTIDYVALVSGTGSGATSSFTGMAGPE